MQNRKATSISARLPPGIPFQYCLPSRSRLLPFKLEINSLGQPEERAAGLARYNYRPLSAGTQTEFPGISAFYKDAEGAVYHTYSTYGRGIEMANATYQLLDLVPKGRDEKNLPTPMSWVRFKDEYSKSA